MFKKFYRFTFILLSPVLLGVGWCIYLTSHRTPNFAYQSMIVLFCLTRGLSNDLMSKVIGIFRRPYTYLNYEGVLGKSTKLNLENIDQRLRKDGYYVFNNGLSEEQCQVLLEFATTQECTYKLINDEIVIGEKRDIYPRGAPQATRYEFYAQDLLKVKLVQKLIADNSLADVAQRYLGASPLVDIVHMWWATDFSENPDKEAAQFYHFDMDRPKWIKFFFYITDVEPNNGPHVFVKGSHKTNSIPSSILKKGYARLSDAEVIDHYGEDKIIEFISKKGTIIAEDSRGLHKGKHLQNGDRLVFQIQFSNSTFGSSYQKLRLGQDLTDELKESILKYPRIYENCI